MQITGLGAVNTVRPVGQGADCHSRPQGGGSPSVSIGLSPAASWVNELRAASASLSCDGDAQVAQARQEIQDGTLEQNIDMDDVLNALLMEL